MSRARAPAVALLVLGLLVLGAWPSLADWDETMPAKWVQLPDLTPMGIDVDVSPPRGDYILADDFPCNETGRITGIHLWGSWYHDMVEDPSLVTFVLSIHADIPASQNPDGYSMPGEVLWTYTFQPGSYTVRPWQDGLQEGWLDPPDIFEYPGDTVCWQYNFQIPPDEAFLQEGTPDSTVIYWLDVKAFPEDPATLFGWKSSQDHWNDDAVFGHGAEPYPGPWEELRYPPGHELVGQSMDLAFVIVSEPEPQTFKWEQPPDLSPLGMDVQDTRNNSPQRILADDFLCTEDGLITGIRVWGSWIGDLCPTDPTNVRFTLSIHSDIPMGPDGYSIPGPVLWTKTFEPGTFQAGVWAQDLQEGWLVPPDQYGFPADTICWVYDFAIPAWEAFHQQGSPEAPVVYWLDVQAEMVIVIDTAWGWKTSSTHWNDDAVWGEGVEPYDGPWYELRYPPGHELEGQSVDLAFALTGEPYQESWDWGDAPDLAGTPGYPTLAANGGASHLIVPGFCLGNQVDAEPDGQPDATATGDDLAGVDDEDGVVFTTTLRPGQLDTVVVTVAAAGFVDAWIDFENNRSWAESNNQILNAAPVTAGANTFVFTVPTTACTGCNTFARFRFSSVGGLPPGGPAPDGEVEDYAVTIEEQATLKWHQAPDLNRTGIDVAAGLGAGGQDFILADDFLCTRTGPLTDFRIFGSWLGDYLPFGGDPTAVKFTLSIHADIPDTMNPEGFSIPGDVLWTYEFQPGAFTAEPWAAPVHEGWLDPPDLYYANADTVCWRYGFHVDPHLAFQQQGSPDQPVVYWLDLKAVPLDPEARFGWKTSNDHWNDDAVWGVGAEPYPGPWQELRYPPQHPDSLQSIDLAFTLLEDLITNAPDGGTPHRLNLRQNAPNPFNPRTEIAYTVPGEGTTVRLAVYDARGRRVRVLVDGFQAGGDHAVTWDGKDDAGRALPAGVYFARLRAAGRSETVKMSLVR